jgi:hypothetical protein
MTVSREESDAPPPTARVPYFSSRTGSYAKAAAEALNRLTFFFRYRLHQPFLEEIAHTHQVFQNPQWFDENEVDVGHGPTVDRPSFNTPTRFGVIPFQKKHEKRLTRAISQKRVPQIHEEFLSDAQASAVRGNIRRAVLELAIACEVAVKRKFFGRATGKRTVDRLLRYLDDNGDIRPRVIDVVNKAAKAVFGNSFKDFHQAAFADLNQLFQCRNKVAHRGQPVFHNQTGAMQTATDGDVERWLDSARVLFVWLKTLRFQ